MPFRLPFPFFLLALFVPFAALSPLPAQDPPKVEVPTFANATCPIMGKKVSMPLFVDTELGRFYLCCKPCIKKVQADVPTAHQTAYPVVQEVKNTTCPISGEAIGEGAATVTLQGFRFQVCCAGCVEAARTHSQVTLLKITSPQVKDVGNTTCPVSGAATAANAFVRIGDSIVHLADPKLLDDVAKAPTAVLAKAEAIAKAQPPRPKHVHQRSPAKQPPAPRNDGKEAGK